MNSIIFTLALAVTLFFDFGNACIILATDSLPTDAIPQNGESNAMQDMLRPYLDLSYNPAEGVDRDRPSIKENADKILQVLPEKLSARADHKRRILVLTYKTHGELHVPGAAGLLELVRGAANKYPGAFEFVECYTSAEVDAAMLARFDAVVLNNIGQTWGVQEKALYNQLIPDYVKHGGGLFAIHGTALLWAIGQAKPADLEFNKMLGGFTMVSPLLASMVHPKGSGKFNHVAPFAIKLIEPNNPLAAAFQEAPAKVTFKSCQLNGDKRVEWPVTINPPLELADELYVISPESNQDHAARCIVSIDADKVPKESFPTANDFSYSLIWIKSYGKGRVYYSQLGHNQAVFSVPCVARAMLDGLQYVTGDLKVSAATATTTPSSQPMENRTR